MDKLSEHADAIWGLLWEYIANENTDESYSEEMAERLCGVILPQVWDYVLRLDKQTDEVAQLEAEREILWQILIEEGYTEEQINNNLSVASNDESNKDTDAEK